MIRRQDLEKGEALATPMHDATPFSFTLETHRPRLSPRTNLLSRAGMIMA